MKYLVIPVETEIYYQSLRDWLLENSILFDVKELD